jgi:hypothetical protein
MQRGLGVAVVGGALALANVAGCDDERRPPRLPSAPLSEESGAVVDATALATSARFTAFVFFSSHCHCLDAHDARLRELDALYAPRGVAFVMVDSEAGGEAARDAAEARRRGYRFPIVVDRGAVFADAMGAAYATYTVVVDPTGRVRYRGGIDSDRIHLHDDATFYLRDAFDDLLAGNDVRRPEGKALGCALEK